jgi:cytochrome P450
MAAYKPIPYVQEPPLLGSALKLRRDRFGLLEQLAGLGPVGGFHLGPLAVVAFNDPRFIHSLLVEHADDFDKGWTQHRAFVGNGVFISEGAFHAKQRKIMAPAFQPRQVAGYADVMASYAEKLAQQWQNEQEIEASRAMSAVTLSIIGKTLFDENVFTETDELGKSLKIVFDHAAHMVISPWIPPNWPTPFNRAKDRAWETIRNRLQRMIDERRAHPTPRSDFLSLLMEARDDEGQPMDDAQLMDEASTLFSGGQETVANAMTWAWYLLASHPDIYQAMQAEIDGALAGRTPTLADLKQLPFTLQVFKEVLRLYPPAPVTIRQALRDVIITDQEGKERYLVKKGTLTMACIYAIHRSAALYPEPECFDPARHFAPEAERALPRYGFMPFGAGPRICIGNHFAMLEGHMLLSTLAQRVTLELLPDQQVKPSSRTLTTRPEYDIRMIVRRR